MHTGKPPYRRPTGPGACTSGALLRALIVLVSLAFATGVDGAPADDRLESPGYGNISEPRFARSYPALHALLIEGHVIPGLHRNFVPQGVDYLVSHPDEVVLSGYFCEGFSGWGRGIFRRCQLKRSALYLYDLAAGEAVRLALLEEPDGQPMRRHAGGVAELFGRLWLPDNFIVFRFNLDTLRGAREQVITMRPENERPIGVDSSGDFITAFDGVLWIGNFQRRNRGRPLPDHYRSPLTGTEGWTAGYRIDPHSLRPRNPDRYRVSFAGREYEVYRPDAALHHRSKVQGLAFTDERRVVLSASYGNNFSALAFHALPAPPAHRTESGGAVTLPDGTTLPVQSLGVPTRRNLIAAPPGAEGIAHNGADLAVAFEGGAMPYRERWRRLEDRLLILLPPPAFHPGR